MPLYTTADAESALSLFQVAEFGTELRIDEGLSLLFRRAGHILGAATATIRIGGKTLAFSGDLGRFNDPIMVDPELIPDADFVIIESTYGDRIHPKVDAAAMLKAVIDKTVRRGGTVVIPAFAIGRTQSLLYELWLLKAAGELELVPIYVDSPMATNATDLMSAHMDDHRLQPEVCREAFGMATYVRDIEGSKALSSSRMPKVIVSASGMATGGRVLHHIKAYGPDPRNTILFAGFQAAGTRGRAMVDGVREVKIHGDWIDIRAEVADLTALSAHADSTELLRWLRGFKSTPKNTFIVHGEPASSASLRDQIATHLGWPSIVPSIGERFDLGDSE